MRHIEITYEVSSPGADVERLAEDLLLEQTFETPRAVVARYPHLTNGFSGEVAEVVQVDDAIYRITLRIPDRSALGSAELLNSIFGNVSIHPEIRLVGFEPSAAVLNRFAGPRFGIAGIRDALSVRHRPLTCTALKPVGLALDELVALCRIFAENGIDVIKDDHYLANQSAAPFEERVRRCADVVAEVSATQGRAIWYVPNLTGQPDEVLRQHEHATAEGVRAVMIAPMTVGLPLMSQLAQQSQGPAVLAHPSFSLSAAVAPEVLWSKLFRIYGADAIIFVNAGGRFAYSEDTCRLIAASMTAPLGALKPSLPVPAGGISLDGVTSTVRMYGNDSMLLIGGSLLSSSDLARSTREFVESVAESALLET